MPRVDDVSPREAIVALATGSEGADGLGGRSVAGAALATAGLVVELGVVELGRRG